MSKQFTSLILGLILVAGCVPLAAQTYTFQQLTIPYAPNADIRANGINNRGAIVGRFLTNGHAPKYRGFKRDANGVLEPPIDAALAAPPYTIVTGITDHGLIVGYTATGQTTGQVITAGFLLYHGVFTYYNAQPGWDTSITGINNQGDFVGQAWSSNGQYGFINSNGVVTKIQCPDSTIPPRTIPQGIAADGTVVGTCEYGAAVRSFVRGPAGRFKFILAFNAWETRVHGINNLTHKVVGDYTGRDNNSHGFVYDYITGITTRVDYPGAWYNVITGINSKGVIVGWGNKGGLYGIVAFVGTPQ